jgi:hypothetical protein
MEEVISSAWSLAARQKMRVVEGKGSAWRAVGVAGGRFALQRARSRRGFVEVSPGW